MKKLLILLVLIVFNAGTSFAYINNFKSWVNNELLSHTDLNGNFSKVNTALDDIDAAITTEIAESTVAVRAAMQLKADMDDSIKARQQSDFYLDWLQATADSVAANDSMAVIPTYANPVGTKQAAYFRNTQGVAEKVQLRWAFKLENKYATIDSIVFNVWTEGTTTTDYGIAYVYKDSLELKFKGTVNTTSDTLRSAVARTTKSISLAPNYVAGADEILLKLIVTQTGDSLFISRPRVYVTNK